MKIPIKIVCASFLTCPPTTVTAIAEDCGKHTASQSTAMLVSTAGSEKKTVAGEVIKTDIVTSTGAITPLTTQSRHSRRQPA